MLVLSRKPGDRIRIGADVMLTVIRIAPDCVRIGIEAPGAVQIWRAELLEKYSQQDTEEIPRTKRGTSDESY